MAGSEAFRAAKRREYACAQTLRPKLGAPGDCPPPVPNAA